MASVLEACAGPTTTGVMGAGASAASATVADGALNRDDCNCLSTSSPRQGDLLRFKRGLYSHWGVSLGKGAHLETLPSLPESIRGSLHPTTTYVGHLTAVPTHERQERERCGGGGRGGGGDFGNGAHIFLTKAVPLSGLRRMVKPSVEVLHAAGLLPDGHYDPLDALAEAEPSVMIHALHDVARGGPVEVANDTHDAYFLEVHRRRPLSPEETVSRLLRCLGLRGYSLLGRNCEHFASWLRYGVAKSMQADDAKTGAARGAAAAVGAVVGGAAAVAAGGVLAVAAAVAAGVVSLFVQFFFTPLRCLHFINVWSRVHVL